jgi:hypothetical protein
MRRVLANTIIGAATAAVTWVIGRAARGPLADPSMPRDLAAGVAIVAAAAAVSWAGHELEGRSDA